MTWGSQIADLVTGAGQEGCGYEASLESWYRFLVDPAPYARIGPDSSGLNFVQTGVDSQLLQQRADFLRSDSLLAILMLTDENDCSFREYDFYPIAASSHPLPKARAECATNPLDECCASCGSPTPPGCPDEPDCIAQDGTPTEVDPADDPPSLRCFHERQRFGLDFLYPVERYAIALTSAQIPNPHRLFNANGATVIGQNDANFVDGSIPMIANPIFSDLQADGSRYPDATHLPRDASNVVLAAVVGVPWQDIARDPSDLTKGFKSADELAEPAYGAASTWDIILGDPHKGKKPLDPHMIESISPRTGVDPATGSPLAPPSSPAGADPINGHEWLPSLRDDLQYACVFTLPSPRDCSAAMASCDCGDPQDAQTNPICEGTTQARAKAYPAPRVLSTVKAMGSQGVVASICPAQLDQVSAADFGYRPAVRALLDRLDVLLPR